MNKILFFVLAMASGILPASAQEYPARVVRVVVPFAPGAQTDILARLVAQHLTDNLKQTFIVENRGTGAGGTIGAASVAKSAPDGYTLMGANTSVLDIAPHVIAAVPYDAINDFAPIGLAAWSPLVLATNASVPAKNVKELIAYARSRPSELSYSSSGNGSSLHLAGELFNQAAGVDIKHIPYKGAAPAMDDVLGGQVQLIFPSVATAMPFVKQGRVRILAVLSKTRFPTFTDVPTIFEAGLPNYKIVPSWVGLVAPARTPAAIVKTLHAEVQKWGGSSDTKQKLSALGLEFEGMSPADFGKVISSGYTLSAEVVKTLGIKVD